MSRWARSTDSVELNLNAFDKGYEYGKELLKQNPEPTREGNVSHVELESANW